MDHIDKFEYPSLPSKDTCYSSLKLSGIRDANYQHALDVYTKFKMFQVLKLSHVIFKMWCSITCWCVWRF